MFLNVWTSCVQYGNYSDLIDLYGALYLVTPGSVYIDRVAKKKNETSIHTKPTRTCRSVLPRRSGGNTRVHSHTYKQERHQKESRATCVGRVRQPGRKGLYTVGIFFVSKITLIRTLFYLCKLPPFYHLKKNRRP